MKAYYVPIPEEHVDDLFYWLAGFATKDIYAGYDQNQPGMIRVEIADDGEFNCPTAIETDPLVNPLGGP